MNESDPVVVNFGLSVQQLMKVDEKEGTMTANFWLNFEWTDPFLTWKKELNEGVQDVRLETEDIWFPDFECYNQVKKEPLRRRDTVVLTDTGTITWIAPNILTTTCKIDPTWFPFDEQNCEIKFGSWTYNGFLMDLKLNDDNADLSSFVTNSEWALIGVPASRNEVLYECCPEPYLDITFNMKMRRRSLKYLQSVVFPSFFLSLISCLSLLIPPARPSPRVLIIISSLLLILIHTPKNLPHPSRLSSLLSHTVLLHLLILLETIAAASVATSLPTAGCLSSFTMWLGELLWRSQEKKTLSQQEVRHQLARILDYICLIVFILVTIYTFGMFFLTAPLKISY